MRPAMALKGADEIDVGGHRLRISSLDRVVFPRAGVTKGALLDYYVRVADTMLAHLRERLLHMHRYPEGVDGPRFWQKGCPEHRPEWMALAPVWSEAKGATIDFCVVNELASLLWAVNIGSIELHTSLHTRDAMHRPTARGLQVYVPLNRDDVTYAQTKPVAKAIAQTLEAESPDRVISRMARAERRGRVLVDWGQNTEHKSMVCAYSVRAKERPTVSTPVTWEEVEAAVAAGDAAALVFEMGDVLERIGRHGDLFARALTVEQDLARLR
jgi:bifunctional non-homologous end joining protein LigD